MKSGELLEAQTGTEPVPPHGATDQSAATLLLRRRERLRMLPMVAASYVIDSALLCAYVVSAALTWQVPAAYLASGLSLCAAFYLILHSALPERLRDHHLVMAQMVAHSTLQMLFLIWVPQVGVPLMMLCFVIFGFGALRMKFRTVVFGSIALAVAMGLVIVSVATPVGLPFATPLERATGGLWFAIVLSRLAFVGQHGAHLRALLTEQRALLTAALAKVERLANRDELTGAMNRRAIVALVRDEQDRMKRSGTAFAVALFDIDLFKQVNDGHGHLIGDGVLRRFCVSAEEAIRTTDRLGRFGGEEFLVLMPATDRPEAALAAAERVREAVARADWAALDKNLQVTVSAGVSIATAEDSLETLLGRADVALYAAKRDGRNRVCSA